MDGASLKERVRAHWENEVCGSRYGLEKASDRRAFFKQIDDDRYVQDYMIKDFARFEETAGKRVLEVGLGTGADFSRWVKAGARASGRDLTSASVALVRERLALDGLSADVERGDAENLDFDDGTFDLYYSWGVLMATPDTRQAIAEAHRVLKPGGQLKIMLYHWPSVGAFLVWIRFGLLKGKLRGVRSVYYDNVESPGMKMYSVPEARALIGEFFRPETIVTETLLGSGDLLTHRLSDRYQGRIWKVLAAVYPRWFVRRVLGHRLGTNLMISARK